MATKTVLFDFYSIDYIDYGELSKALKLDKTKYLNNWVKHKYNYVRLESWEHNLDDDIIIGHSSKINLRELPYKGSLTTKNLEELPLNSDEGTASVTSFVIVPSYRTLILQRNRDGVGAGSFLNLLIYATEIKDLELSIMIDQEALRKMNKMQKITAFTYKMANPSGYNLDLYKDTSVNEAAKLSEHYQSRVVKVELSMGKDNRDDSMALRKVKDSAKKLLKLKNENDSLVHSIEIKGKETDDEKLESLNLIKRKLINDVKIELVNRVLPVNELKNAAWQSYKAKELEVASYKPL